jgi:hypothetical protein
VLLEKFEGSFVNCIRQSKKSSRTLIELVIDNFSSYRDEALFLGRSGSLSSLLCDCRRVFLL